MRVVACWRKTRNNLAFLMPTTVHRLAVLVLWNAAAGMAFAGSPDWENEQVTHLNTEAPRATFVPFATWRKRSTTIRPTRRFIFR